MSEAEILSLLENYTEQQTQLIIQVVSLHFALVVGVFYFLHRSGLAMKLAVFRALHARQRALPRAHLQSQPQGGRLRGTT